MSPSKLTSQTAKFPFKTGRQARQFEKGASVVDPGMMSVSFNFFLIEFTPFAVSELNDCSLIFRTKRSPRVYSMSSVHLCIYETG
ncbi:hypothetical protein GDO81_003418 [Engystomops pustulosus]|uniref:Uncharacterized protein n=1 Tax=Engystomops pustulosus TaxID=76066 RepID=A0AAV6ZZN3_ENGPU|nr:hypothetical protein GDO81_003418 [Engystomops pustulosus]